MQFIYPYLATIIAWLAGRIVLSTARMLPRSETLSVIVGVSAIVIIIGNLSFFGVGTGTAVALSLTTAIIITSLILRKASFSNIDYREIFIIGIVCAISSTYFLLPAALHRANLVLIEAGDFKSYISMGGWLQTNPITIPADLGVNYNPIQYRLLEHQTLHLRLGALFLSSFYASLFGISIAAVYTSFISWLIVLQAIALCGLTRVAIPQLRPWPSCLVASLYAVNPVLTWSGYASFIPQILGIALMGALLTVGLILTDAVLDKRHQGRRPTSLVFVFGLLLCANWSAYPEILPVALAILGLHGLFSIIQARSRRGWGLLNLVFLLLISLAVWFALSPMSARWGMDGMAAQLRLTPHGGEQIVTAWTMLGTMFGASLEPLIPIVLNNVTVLQTGCGALLLVCTFVGIVYVAASRRIAFVASVTASATLLFIYVGYHYALGRNPYKLDSNALLTWNYFKAAQYILMPAYTIGLGGFVHALTGFSHSLRLLVSRLALLVPIMCSLVLAVGQFERINAGASTFNISPDIIDKLRDIPSGRILVDLKGDDDTSSYRRWLTYAIMPNRALLSTKDAPGLDLDTMPASPNSQQSSAIAYVVTGESSIPSEVKLLSINNVYRVIDIRNTLYAFTIPTQGTTIYLSSGNSKGGQAEIYNVVVPQLIIRAGKNILSLPTSRTSSVTINSEPGLLSLKPEPKQRGLVVDLVDTAFGPKTILDEVADLTAQLNETMIAKGDATSMEFARLDSGFELTKQNYGFSRLFIRAHLMPGVYFFRMDFGQVKSEVAADSTGFGAYIGFDNKYDTAVDLEHAGNTIFFYRFVVDTESDIACGLGFGAWGAARGSIEVKNIQLLKQD